MAKQKSEKAMSRRRLEELLIKDENAFLSAVEFVEKNCTGPESYTTNPETGEIVVYTGHAEAFTPP
jgi:hypothetical protein